MVHNYLGAGTYMFPLNVGYIAAYAHKHFAAQIDVKIFKYPNRLLQELNRGTADIVGFSHYAWNADLNNNLSHIVKSVSKKTIWVDPTSITHTRGLSGSLTITRKLIFTFPTRVKFRLRI